MTAFIRKLARDFNIQITESDVSGGFDNTYSTDNAGEVIALKLYQIGLTRLDILSPLCEHLKVLVLQEDTLENIEAIKDFTNLEELDFYAERVSSLKGIEKLSNLRALSLSLDISSIEEIEQLSSLRTLRLWCSEIPYITGLEHLEYLERLELSGLESTSTNSICGVDSVKDLILKNNPITEIDGMDKFPNLEFLSLFSTSVPSIHGLESLKKLKVLHLGSTQIVEMEGLENLDNLEFLGLSHNSIPKIRGLETLVNLKELYLSNYLGESLAPITEIQGVEHLEKLERLILTGHEIVELRNLPTENLRHVDVSWNKLSYIDYDWLNACKQPCTIDLTGNPVDVIIEQIPDHISIINKRKN